jgi:hypothetical protein
MKSQPKAVQLHTAFPDHINLQPLSANKLEAHVLLSECPTPGCQLWLTAVLQLADTMEENFIITIWRISKQL